MEVCTRIPTTRKNIHIRKVHDEVRVNNAQNERFDRQMSGNVCGKVGKIILKCDYLLNIRTFCVSFQREFVTLYQEQ